MNLTQGNVKATMLGNFDQRSCVSVTLHLSTLHDPLFDICHHCDSSCSGISVSASRLLGPSALTVRQTESYKMLGCCFAFRILTEARVEAISARSSSTVSCNAQTSPHHAVFCPRLFSHSTLRFAAHLSALCVASDP